MKKLFLLLIIIILIGLGFFTVYKIYYPKVVAKVFVNKKRGDFLPQKIEEKLPTISDTAFKKIDKLIESNAQYGLSVNQLETAISELKKKNLKVIYGKLKDIEITSAEQVFDTISNNLSMKSIDIERFRKIFIAKVEKEQIKKVINYIEKHDLFNTLDEEVAREIALQILEQREAEIKKNLEETK